MLEAIYTGTELGAGGGGGGSTNPTSGVMPVNIFGTFQDSNVKSDTPIGNNTEINVSDNTQLIQLLAGASYVTVDGSLDVVNIFGNDRVNITGNNGINANGPLVINTHLGLALLRFLSNGASHAAIKVTGNLLEIRNGNDSQYNDFAAQDVTGRGVVKSFSSFQFSGAAPTAERGFINAPTDGIFTLLNSAQNNFKNLQFGGTTGAFPMIAKQSVGLAVKTADDTAFTTFAAQDIDAKGKLLTAQDMQVTARSILRSLVDGNFTLLNAAASTFGLLQFGGTTNTFPALKRSGTELQARLADDSGPAPLRSATFTVEGTGNGISFANNIMNIYAGVTVGNSIIYGNLNGVSIGKGNTLPVASAQLEVVSTTRGFLPPRMTDAQRLAIASPAQGLIVYQTNTNGAILEGLYIYKSTGWTFII